jgi:hypothetical protein
VDLDRYKLILEINVCYARTFYETFHLVQQVTGRGRTEIGKVNFRRFHLFIGFYRDKGTKKTILPIPRFLVSTNGGLRRRSKEGNLLELRCSTRGLRQKCSRIAAPLLQTLCICV